MQKSALQKGSHYWKLLFVYSLSKQFIHLKQRFKLMGKQIIAFHFLNPQILRIYLLNETADDEVALEFAAKAK